MKKALLALAALVALFGSALAVQAQQLAPFRWLDPLDEGAVVHGVGWDELRSGYVRLPDRAHGVVRSEVWDLSRNSAGLSLVFESDAPEMIVLYGVKDGLGMFHMPSTGRSGLDLYATDSEGRLRWVAPDFPAKMGNDTTRYIYSGISYYPEGSRSYEYHLYLPPYNTITWLKIGLPSDAMIRFLPETRKHPVVIYGTSITQGACASRPGNGWTDIVERELGLPVVNLGFSGNGRLEPEVLELIAEIDASLYILDTTPNLTHATDIEFRILEAVRYLRMRSDCPILLVEHSGNVGEIASDAKAKFRKANAQVRSAYETLRKRGIPEIYYMTHEELGLPMDGMVEGVHPNDLGMRALADGFEKKILEIKASSKTAQWDN
jgi:lysophospholipase L1-like esterase